MLAIQCSTRNGCGGEVVPDGLRLVQHNSMELISEQYAAVFFKMPLPPSRFLLGGFIFHWRLGFGKRPHHLRISCEAFAPKSDCDGQRVKEYSQHVDTLQQSRVVVPAHLVLPIMLHHAHSSTVGTEFLQLLKPLVAERWTRDNQRCSRLGPVPGVMLPVQNVGYHLYGLTESHIVGQNAAFTIWVLEFPLPHPAGTNYLMYTFSIAILLKIALRDLLGVA